MTSDNVPLTFSSCILVSSRATATWRSGPAVSESCCNVFNSLKGDSYNIVV